jgi:2-methylcitrate dehydratase PrpD
MDQTLASALAKFAVETTHANIPDNVRKAALWHVLDTIGVCIAGASPMEESGVAARRLAEKWKARSGSMIFGLNANCRPEMAALLNGSLAQALEMDDKHGSSLARPGSTVTPAVLAVAQQNNMSLTDVVTAVTVGYEVMIRLGFVAGDRFLERGYHTSSLLGAFGTVAAIGSLLRSSAEDVVNALGIAGTFAAGIQEATRTGSTSKILHGGWGAHSGVVALDLATAGITGPSSVFEGKFGFFRCFLTPIAGELDFAKAAEGLGRRWYLPETAYKPYPCCQLLHAFIEGAKQIRTELKEMGKPIDTIETISCQLAEPGLTLVTEPKDRKAAPSHPHEARFSLPYGVATTLIYGDVDVESFRPERLKDPEVLRLAEVVVSSEDPDSDYPQHCPAIIEVTALGRVHRRHIRFHPGSPEAALSESDVLDKFARNSAWFFGNDARDIGYSLVRDESASLESVLRKIVAGSTHSVEAAV